VVGFGASVGLAGAVVGAAAGAPPPHAASNDAAIVVSASPTNRRRERPLLRKRDSIRNSTFLITEIGAASQRRSRQGALR
jgi:hypothetical protein